MPKYTLNYTTIYVRFEAFTAVTMKNVIFWDVALCRSCVGASASLANFATLKMEAIHSSETSVSTQDLHSATSQKTTFLHYDYFSKILFET
jgi:hypothetical protein